ncbi:hypothetical protein RB653_005050 [Dictyostelium firmibasis]|uniref:Methyltransferase type 11 domain-containing protein n=1 Tax=Dictyostelium firmibasis TaxID=79012 RepID=A0AAN7UBN4_9MYCE
MKIFTSEELEQKWDGFSKIFQHYNECTTAPVAFLLITSLGITSQFGSAQNSCKSILEVACGPGAGTKLCLDYKNDLSKFIATDISNEMVQLTKESLRMKQDTNEIPEKNFKIQQCNAEKLPFEDGSFDRYFSNYCLHLVTSPETMLKEAYRVLESGGIAAFSVWGRPENSNQFTIVKKIADEIGLEMSSQERSAFHLNDTNKLRQMALDAGFSRVLAGHSFVNSPIQNGEEYAEVFLSPPSLQKLIQNLEKEKYLLWKSKIVSHVDELLNKGEFIGSEVSYIVCTK